MSLMYACIQLYLMQVAIGSAGPADFWCRLDPPQRRLLWYMVYSEAPALPYCDWIAEQVRIPVEGTT